MRSLRRLLARSVTLVLLAALVAGSAGVHIGEREDPFCDFGPVHDASQHRVGPSRGDPVPEASHCFLCHWQRSFRTVLVAIGSVDLRLAASCDLVTITAPHVHSHVDFSIPPRAPPA